MKKSIVQQIKALPIEQQALVPEIKVEIEPVFEVTTPAPDLAPMTAAIERLMLKPVDPPNVDVHMHHDKKPKRVRIDVERDNRGFIKSLLCTELTDV